MERLEYGLSIVVDILTIIAVFLAGTGLLLFGINDYFGLKDGLANVNREGEKAIFDKSYVEGSCGWAYGPVVSQRRSNRHSDVYYEEYYLVAIGNGYYVSLIVKEDDAKEMKRISKRTWDALCYHLKKEEKEELEVPQPDWEGGASYRGQVNPLSEEYYQYMLEFAEDTNGKFEANVVDSSKVLPYYVRLKTEKSAIKWILLGVFGWSIGIIYIISKKS